MNRPILVVVSALAFSAIGMLSSYLDHGYSPVGGAFIGGLLGCGLVFAAELKR